MSDKTEISQDDIPESPTANTLAELLTTALGASIVVRPTRQEDGSIVYVATDQLPSEETPDSTEEAS